MNRELRRSRDLSLIVDYPRSMLVLLAVITLVAIIGYYDPQLLTGRPEPVTSAPVISGAATRGNEVLPDVRAVQLSGWDAVVLVQSNDLFQPTSAAALREVVAAFNQLDHVDEVFWLEDIPPLNIFGLREPVLPADGSSEHRFSTAKLKALQNPLIGGFILSPDAKSTMIMVRFDWLFVRDDSDCSAGLIAAAQRAAERVAGADLSFHVTGRVPLRIALMERNQSNERMYQIIGNLFTMIMAAILFRGLTAVIVVALAPGLGVFWTMGILRFFDLQDNPFNHVVTPVMISLVGFTDGVHMMVQIRANRVAGMTALEATRKTLREVGLACFLTSLTTAIGFASLGLAHHQVVREFGWCCVIGVSVTFVAAVTVIPLLCLTRLGDRVQAGHGRGLIDKHFDRFVQMIEFILRHRGKVTAWGLIVFLVLIGVSATLRPDERNTSSLPNNGEEMESLRMMDRLFGGLETGEVQVSWNDTIADNAPEVLEVIHEVDQLLRSEPLLGNPVSLAALVSALPGDRPIGERASLIELLPPPLKRRFFVPERNESMISYRVQDLGIATYGPVFERIETGLTAITTRHPAFVLTLAGDAFWRWSNIYRIVMDLLTSLGTASIIIFGVLGVAYRSVRIGLIAIAPNIFPLAATGTLLALGGYSLEMVTVCAFTICLGIAVDDTIHFLTRYQEEFKVLGDTDEAIRRAFVAAGTGMIMTTIVLVAGFCTALASDTRDHRLFVSMGILTVASALVGDLVLLPALLAYFPGRQKKRAVDMGGETQRMPDRPTPVP